ncbi:MAG: sugar phosphate isomerase/epimerase, partial [Candidatus Sumerlaeota bacterium]|nr:sugar phosphate isomerase/epimerase [Candidatus Sumerlaeota bacterium]
YAKKAGFEAFASFLKKNGFDTVDCPSLDAKTKALCDKIGIGIGSVDNNTGLLSENEAESQAGLQKAKDGISAIADNGGSVMFTVVKPGDAKMLRKKAFEIFQRVYPALVAHAEAKGVKIAMEPWPGGAPAYSTLGCTPETLRAMFKEIPSKSLGICYDPSHFARLQINYLRLLGEFGDRVYHVHLKDCEILEEGMYEYGILGRTLTPCTHSNSEGWWRYCIPGKGLVQWSRVINRLRDFHYQGTLSIELEDTYYRETDADQQRGIIAAKDYIAAVLDRK